MKRNLFSFPRSQMVGKMLRAMSFVVAVFWWAGFLFLLVRFLVLLFGDTLRGCVD